MFSAKAQVAKAAVACNLYDSEDISGTIFLMALATLTSTLNWATNR